MSRSGRMPSGAAVAADRLPVQPGARVQEVEHRCVDPADVAERMCRSIVARARGERIEISRRGHRVLHADVLETVERGHARERAGVGGEAPARSRGPEVPHDRRHGEVVGGTRPRIEPRADAQQLDPGAGQEEDRQGAGAAWSERARQERQRAREQGAPAARSARRATRSADGPGPGAGSGSGCLGLQEHDSGREEHERAGARASPRGPSPIGAGPAGTRRGAPGGRRPGTASARSSRGASRSAGPGPRPSSQRSGGNERT